MPNIASSWTNQVQSLAYIVAALLFILALAGLSRQVSAQRGNQRGMIGMAIALVATVIVAFASVQANLVSTIVLTIVAMIIGGTIGIYKARKVEMTGMPELIALLHSFVGLAAVFVGFNSFILHPSGSMGSGFHLGEVGLAVFIGAVTLTGSVVAYLKLAGKLVVHR